MAAADEYTQRLRDVFDLCDIDKRGYISIDHFVQLANEHFGTSGWDTENQESLSHIVQVLDPDGNGSLNFVQFSEGVKRIVELQAMSVQTEDETDGTEAPAAQDTADVSGSAAASDAVLSDDHEVSQPSTPQCHNGDVTMSTSWCECDADVCDSSTECSLSDPPRLVTPPRIRSQHSSPVSARVLSSCAVARQLQRAGSVQLDTSRRSSMSDIIIEDIDGNFVELNDKVRRLEHQVQQLTESQRCSDERHAKLRDENGHFVERVHLLEEQLRETEMKAANLLAEEQRRSRDVVTRCEKEKSTEIDLLTRSLQSLDAECSVLKSELPRLRAENDQLHKENIQQSAEIDQLSTQLSELTKGHKTLQDEAAEVHVKITQERRVHVQLVEELSRELDELRCFKAEFMSKSRSDFPAELLQKHRKELEAAVVHLKQENASLREELDDVQAQLLSSHVEEGQQLLVKNSFNDASLMNLTHDQIVDRLHAEQESNRQLREYVERITLRILEKNPSILEIASRHK